MRGGGLATCVPPAISDEARARLMELKVNGSAPSERSAKVAPDFNGTTDATLTPALNPGRRVAYE